MTREKATDIVAEMVANVMTVSVDVGDEVGVGDQMLMLESMKMEIPVLTECAGTVTNIRVTAGDVVQEGDILITLRNKP
ncbi:biotin/lipoyl-binding carrier protein [Nocardioides sp. JQ2195]|uniref:biotin/lipoyl-binding carrier protein n=1 Tax=Nocardioides sp. JQ2195 TaxID=2592334 RepID=UPI00143E38D5|nr:biotin/lipoyl-binding carrier protein [Nocardioides sp. JQ2195]QIX25261.1 biotin/lipoyl-binding carrier protein [Nocardioides sp. JQ2195]